MTRYAKDTSVSSDKSRMEIEKILRRYGAGSFMFGTTPIKAVIVFEMCGRRIKFELPLPDRSNHEFTHFKNGKGSYTERSVNSAEKTWEQACRQRWRALALAIKAKLEAVECGITSFDEEFLSHIVLPNGRTMGELYVPQIEHSYATKEMPPLLERF